MSDVTTLTLNNGVIIPALGLGVFQTPPDETRNAVTAALASGAVAGAALAAAGTAAATLQPHFLQNLALAGSASPHCTQFMVSPSKAGMLLLATHHMCFQCLFDYPLPDGMMPVMAETSALVEPACARLASP